MAKIIVLGGGLSGFFAALAARRAGHDVSLADSHSFLGRELTATGHSWLRNGKTDFELYAPVGGMKKYLLQTLIDEGVTLWLLNAPCGVALSDGEACGALLAGKFGLTFAGADGIIDATDGAIAFPGAKRAGECVASYVFECSRARTLYETALPLPESLNVRDNTARLHFSALPDTLSVEFRVTLRRGGRPDERARQELDARLTAERVFAYLKTLNRFENIELSRMACEMLAPDAAEPFGPRERVARFAYPWPLDPSTDDFACCAREAEKMVSALDVRPSAGGAPDELELFGRRVSRFRLGEPRRELMNLTPVTLDSDAAGWEEIGVQTAVAGAGTSGAMSVMAALSEGVRTAVIEPYYQPGGTRTLGRVAGHWHGHRGGASERVNEEVRRLSDTLREKGALTDSAARMLLYQKKFTDENCVPLLGYTVCGAQTKDGRLEALLACGEDRLVRVRAHVFVDMTSDADAAFLAGVPCETGCPRDGSVMTNGQSGDSLWSRVSFGDNPYSRDYDMIRPDSYADLVRAVEIAHGYNSDVDFSPINTMRESRRIRGRHTLTLSEILLKQSVPDAVAMTDTPYDVHGRASSPVFWMGLGGGPLKAFISYGCFVPEGLEGLLVGGKSLSATRDAACVCRMNADVENAGWALGLAAAQAVRAGCAVSEIDVDALRARLMDMGCIESDSGRPVGPEEAVRAIEKGERDALAQAILQPRDRMMPLLRDLAAQNDTAAMALCWFGEDEGVRRVVRMARETRDVSDLSLLLTDKGYGRKGAAYEGDPGAVYGEDIAGYYRLNRLIVLLGASANREALPVLIELAGRARTGGAPIMGEGPYHKNRLDARTVPGFERIACVCFALERLADPEGIAPLEAILNQPYAGGWLQREKIAPLSLAKCAWLELCIARALARCGGRSGYERLASYVSDAREVFSRHAGRELSELTGRSFDSEALWREWLDRQISFPCVPVRTMQAD